MIDTSIDQHARLHLTDVISHIDGFKLQFIDHAIKKHNLSYEDAEKSFQTVLLNAFAYTFLSDDEEE